MKTLVEKKGELEILLEGIDRGIAELIVEKLCTSKEVTFASANYDHPLKGNPHLIVKAKNAKKELLSAIGAVRSEMEEFETELKKKL